jgi:ArsR family transcriptional regulator
LLHFELNVGEIVQIMDMGQSRISRHLKILSDSGLVVCRREGLWAFYRASEDGAGRDFLDGVASLFEDDEVFRKDRNLAVKVIRERTAETRKFFDDIAPEWGRMTSEVLGGLNLHKEIHQMLGGCKCAADIGCGPGDMLSVLASVAESVIGVDNSPKMLELAEARFSADADVSLRIGEMGHLPIRDQEIDCAVMSLVLHHLARPLEAIEEAARCLKSSGKLLIAEYDRHDNESMRSEYGDRRLGIRKDKMLDWLDQAGFRPLQSKEFIVNKGLVVVLYEAEKK